MTAPIISDPDWDWIPITAGSEVDEGDTIVWAAGNQFVVDEITTATNDEGGTTYTFSDASHSVAAEVDVPPLVRALRSTSTQYAVTPHPPVGSTFRNVGDDSMWVFTASKAYRCWKAGTRYPVGTVLTRVQIDGTIVAT